MGSTSSSTTRSWKYDVFLSFRGKDTRSGFISHLENALLQNQIEMFIDDRLSGGEEISPALLKTIEESSISVVIFSQNYADSPWCLDELEKILECKQKFDQKVLPIFYQVDPTNVQELTGSFGDALVKHQQQFSLHKVEKWSHSLKEIANLKGWDSQNITPESKLIQEIVNDILKKLNHMPSGNFDDLGNFLDLFGINSRIQEVKSLLRIGSPGVFIVGIWGMGGIGKTTVAEAVFGRISTQFDSQCFIPNVREESDKRTLVCLRNEILSTILKKENLNMGMIKLLPSSIRKMLRKKNVLIVLDDVDSCQKLEVLVGDRGLYGSRSRIIVTSRDKQVIENGCDKIYEVKKLDYQESLELFQLHAFKQNHCIGRYLELSKRAVNYADGIPLALKVLGCDLYKKGIKEWENKLAKLDEIPDMEIQKVLRISYDGLDWNEQRIFLDIACFFKECDKDYVEGILDRCGSFSNDGIRHLIDKSLITISNNIVVMHDLIQQMGQVIVFQECINEPGKRSRLWFHNDICRVLTKQTGTATVETISLDMSKIKEIHLCPTAFKGMDSLRLLGFKTHWWSKEINVQLCEGLEFLSDELRLLEWDQYPLKSLPSNFCPENLVELRMSNSCIEQLWDGVQPDLVNLKILDLSYSVDLVGIPDFSHMPNLEVIDLAHCRSLVEVPLSFRCCSKLTFLNLAECKNLCSFPVVPSNIKELYLGGTAIEQVPSSIGDLSHLLTLHLRCCKRLENLPSSIGHLQCLEDLDLGGCSKLASLPSSICDLKSLEILSLDHCPILNGLPENLWNFESLKELRISNSISMVKPLSSINQQSKLQILSLYSSGILEIPNNLSCLVSLEELFLNDNNFERIPESIKQLSKLGTLGLSDCQMLQCLPELPSSLEHLNVSNCTSLRSVPNLFENAIGRFEVIFANCFNLDQSRIMADVHLELQRGLTELSMCIPGKEVPHWFRHKGTGSSVTVKPHCCNCEILGWVVCTVVADNDVYDFSKIQCICHSTTESRHLSHPSCFLFGPMKLESEHVLLWYDREFNGSINGASFGLKDFNHGFGNHKLAGPVCELIKCGIHPVVAQDKNHSQVEEEENWLSLSLVNKNEDNEEDGNQEDEPHPKKLKMEISKEWLSLSL